jgi:hypothetical protein
MLGVEWDGAPFGRDRFMCVRRHETGPRNENASKMLGMEVHGDALLLDIEEMWQLVIGKAAAFARAGLEQSRLRTPIGKLANVEQHADEVWPYFRDQRPWVLAVVEPQTIKLILATIATVPNIDGVGPTIDVPMPVVVHYAPVRYGGLTVNAHLAASNNVWSFGETHDGGVVFCEAFAGQWSTDTAKLHTDWLLSIVLEDVHRQIEQQRHAAVDGTMPTVKLDVEQAADPLIVRVLMTVTEIVEAARRTIDRIPAVTMAGVEEPPEMLPRDRQNAVIDMFFVVQDNITKLARTKGNDATRSLAAYMRAARIFDMPPTLLHRMTKSVMTFMGARPGEEDALEPLIRERSAKMPAVTQDRPFNVMYLGFGAGVSLQDDAVEDIRREILENRPVKDAQLIAYVIGGPNVWMITYSLVGDEPVLSFMSVYDGKWNMPLTLSAWLVPWLIQLINQQTADTVVERQQGVAFRHRIRRAANKMKVRAGVPPPYYTVEVKPHVTKQYGGQQQVQGHEMEWRHRWDVRGHERAYIQRGPLPIDTNDRERLVARGYQVFEQAVDDRCGVALETRGKPPKVAGEWLAVKYRWINEDVRPHDRPDLPYQPSVHRLKRPA